ncbi:hypothetical protein RUM43_001231 [Polyplax serrata]|uniref:C2 domain-containing protein n=1 Tax=Polyplax serrata TaxID=468196 RepID=A0AAN8SDQ8_POLSC
MFLGFWGRFLILVLSSLAVILTVVIVACFVGPGCLGFEYLMRREKKKKFENETLGNVSPIPGKSKIPTPHICESGQNFWMDNQDLVVYQTGPSGMERKISNAEDALVYNTKEKILNLRCTPLLTGRNLYPKVHTSYPKLKIKLSYSSLKNNDTMGRLSVLVMSATSLPPREYISSLDPYVCLNIWQSKWPFQKADKDIHIVQTRVVKNSLNPDFDQTFIFDGIKREIKNWCLKFTIVDSDHLTRCRQLCEKVIYLRDLKNLMGEGSAILNLEMRHSPVIIGTLLFGLKFMPTAQRLNINVIKAAKLKYQNYSSSLLDFYPYVRVIMLNSSGKCLKKKKTCFKQGEYSPIFNQTLIFDLSTESLEQTVFLILLCTKLMTASHNSDESSSIDGDIEKSLKENKDKVLGMIVLGRNVKCTRARNHWVTVMQNPRKMISVWHELR